MEYRETVAQKLHEQVPELRDVTPHAGAFSMEAVKRFSTITPAAKIVFLHMRAMRRDNIGHMIGPATMGIYLITHDPKPDQGFGPALDLAERVADVVELNRWGLEWAAAARVVEIEPLYSEDLDKMGVAVAGVMFTQEIQIGRDRHAEDEMSDHFFGFGKNPTDLEGRMLDEEEDFQTLKDLGF